MLVLASWSTGEAVKEGGTTALPLRTFLIIRENQTSLMYNLEEYKKDIFHEHKKKNPKHIL